MSQQGNFLGGFLLGTVVGGVLGGVVGTLAASRLTSTEAKLDNNKLGKSDRSAKKRSLKASSEPNMEVARRGLEDKIAQLNEAIDDVRQQLSTVNGSEVNREQPITPEP